MALTNEEAHTLIAVPKKIMIEEQAQDEYFMRFSTRIDARFELISEDGNQIFLMEIQQQEKNHLKITFHFQEHSQYIGLLRIDYNGKTHKNPETANRYVPSVALPYMGTFIEGSHVHFYVQGYRPLAWAIPLAVHDFAPKEIVDVPSFIQAVREFCRAINITTRCHIEERLFL